MFCKNVMVISAKSANVRMQMRSVLGMQMYKTSLKVNSAENATVCGELGVDQCWECK